jgi:hypothetical protein
MYRDTRARQSFLRQAGSGIFVALKPKGLPKVMHALLVSLIVFGTLYLAVMIARLVGLHVAARIQTEGDGP